MNLVYYKLYVLYYDDLLFAGFAGSNALEEAQILMVGGCVMDTLRPVLKIFGVEDEATKASTRVVGFTKDMFHIWMGELFRITYFYPTFLGKVYMSIYF